MKITKATSEHLDELVTLFDAYRVFYKQESNITQAKQFLQQRLIQNDSTIFVALINNVAIGFTQLYPLYSSVSMQSMYLLNDLYVDKNHRGKGIGESLIERAKLYCKSLNYKGLAIQTAHDNPAQHLYERLGFEKDSDLHFFWTNN